MQTILLGLTIKSIVEDEENEILNLSYTLTLKCEEDVFKDLSVNINKEGDEIIKYRNRRINQDGSLNKPEISENLISCSGHKNNKVRSRHESDFCPYIVTVYSLSIKLNALNEHNKREKKKMIFKERSIREFIEFQYNSLGIGISYLDIVEIKKVPKNFRESIKINNLNADSIIRIDNNEEIDEIEILFITRRNQIKNIVSIIIPCVIIPIIFGEISRVNSSNPSDLFSGILALIFTMPNSFGSYTAGWYIFSITLIVFNYCFQSSDIGISIEIISIVSLPILIFMIWRRHNLFIKGLAKNGIEIKKLIKGRNESNEGYLDWLNLE